jgi:hypothetical protein
MTTLTTTTGSKIVREFSTIVHPRSSWTSKHHHSSWRLIPCVVTSSFDRFASVAMLCIAFVEASVIHILYLVAESAFLLE